MRFCFQMLCVAVCCCLISGCGPGKANLTPVVGTVTIDDRPANGILVQFVPKTTDESINAPTSQAFTDEAGKFDLYTTNHEHGAVTGPHSVSLIDTLEERPEQGKKATRPPRLDAKFAQGGITVEVVENQSIELKATGPK